MKLLVTFGLSLLAVLVQAQNPYQFVAQIFNQDGDNLIPLSIGTTVITYRHVLTAAQPLRNVPVSQLRVFFSSNNARESEDQREVSYVYYNENNPNIAIIATHSPEGDASEISPMDLAAVSVTNCRTHFFEHDYGEMLYSNVSVVQEGCREGDTWCGTSSRIGMCRNFLGAPIICGAQNNQVNGLVWRDALCTNPQAIQLSILNVNDHAEWIREIAREGGYSGAGVRVVSLFAVAIGVVLSKVL